MRCCLTVVVLFCLCTGLRAEVVDWLYQVEVPVSSQAPSERTQGAKVALLEMLSRLSGQATVSGHPAIESALARPERYFSQFRYSRQRDLDGAEQLYLRLDFAPSEMIDLSKRAGLPLWWANRPKVVAWIVMDDAAGRRILNAEDPFALEVQRRAHARGLDVQLPLMDIDDQSAMSVAAAWNRDTEEAEYASQRYGAEALLFARVTQAGGALSSSWELNFLAESRLGSDNQGSARFNQRAAETSDLAQRAADQLVDVVARRYVVSNIGEQMLSLVVTQVSSPQAYADLLRYIGGLEFVDAVDIAEVRATELRLRIASQAPPERLLELFAVDGLLVRETENGLRSDPSGEIALGPTGVFSPRMAWLGE